MFVHVLNEQAARVLAARDDVDMTIRNNKGETAKERAVAWGYHSLQAILEEAEVTRREKKKVEEEAEEARKKKAEEEEIMKAGSEEEARQELARGVAELAGSDDFTDFKIICLGQEIKCHKVIIAAMSKV